MKKLFAIAFFVGVAATAQAQTVYASEKGSKYHTADCNLSGDAVDIKLADAKKKGKGACGVCKPDDHLKDNTKQCTGKTADKTRCKRMTASKSGKCYQHVGK
jgi:hypothetical protein